MTGMREQEVMYTYWPDLHLAAYTVHVSHKPDRGWTPKAYKEREIPSPSKLAKSLKARQAKWKSNAASCFRLPAVPCDVCDLVAVGWHRSAHSSVVARPFRHGIHDALSEAITKRACQNKVNEIFA
jgi:hypothetical protein